MDTTHPSRTRWRKPARSGSNGNCVEIASTGTAIAVRDSHDPHGPLLAFTAGQWRAFTAALRTQRHLPAASSRHRPAEDCCGTADRAGRKSQARPGVHSHAQVIRRAALKGPGAQDTGKAKTAEPRGYSRPSR